MGGGARLLDLSRLVSRIGRGAFTGIDRVEAAYLRRLLSDPEPLFALVRSSFGYTLYDRAGADALARRLSGEVAWGANGLKTGLRRTIGLKPREDDVRRLAMDRSTPKGLAAMLTRHMPDRTVWINVGHSNLTEAMFDAIDALPGGRSVIMIHDTIPLDHPDWQRPGTVESFEKRLQTVAHRASLVIHTAKTTRSATEAHFMEMHRVPQGIVAPLGIDTPVCDDAPGLDDLGLNRPYFVALGTIEPRKNHALLLDIWEQFQTEIPSARRPLLVLVGARGWNNDAVFQRLDRSPADVLELGAIPDRAIGPLLSKAQALLMPSRAEGFGLPPGEALSLGCPVFASDLPVYREVFGNNIVYLDPDDLYSWKKSIMDAAQEERGNRTGATGLPSWDRHFNLVLKHL